MLVQFPCGEVGVLTELGDIVTIGVTEFGNEAVQAQAN